jgi:hypothetical protein
MGLGKNRKKAAWSSAVHNAFLQTQKKKSRTRCYHKCKGIKEAEEKDAFSNVPKRPPKFKPHVSDPGADLINDGSALH